MSYDLEALRLPPGLSGQARAELFERDQAAEQALRLTADDRERLAEALQAADSALERHEGEDEIELDSDALQVFIDASGVTMNIPYHGLDDAGRSPLDRAFAHADVITEHGLTVWDPQAEAIVGESDRAAAADRFAATSDRLDQLVEPAPPRWKFWKR